MKEYMHAVPLIDIDSDVVFWTDGKEWTVTDPDTWEGCVVISSVYDSDERVMAHDSLVLIKKEDVK